MTSRRLLLVGLGVMGRPYLAAAHAAGVSVIVLDSAAALASEDTRALLSDQDVAVPVGGGTDEHWYLAANEAVATYAPDGVLAFAEPHVRTAALIADEFGLPGPGLRAAEVSRNKAYQRALFARHEVAQPAFGLATDATEAAAWVAAHTRYPVVAKALHGTASAGVRLVHGEADLTRYATERPSGEPFLVEEYADGPESSCEALVHDGELIFASLTDKLTGPAPYFVEQQHVVPGERTEQLRPEVEELVRTVVRALGVGSALLHLEFRATARGLRVMEFAVRTPGDFLMDLIALAHGIDVFAAAVALALGERPDVAPGRTAVASSWFPTHADGVLHIDGSEAAAAALPGVARVRMWGQPGTAVRAQRSSNDRIASAIVTAADHEALRERLADVHAALGIRVTPER